ncbi:hypothetical protein RSA3_06410 [Microbacterium testaceum]|uniref:Uncharacterized protein n=1 Tax=Microbacterium testaceum TaxID=2033 RepID=A0A147F9F8_MICTE|nr:hypothetical protein RSA3_06410 [Microbacterium testaceum]
MPTRRGPGIRNRRVTAELRTTAQQDAATPDRPTSTAPQRPEPSGGVPGRHAGAPASGTGVSPPNSARRHTFATARDGRNYSSTFTRTGSG